MALYLLWSGYYNIILWEVTVCSLLLLWIFRATRCITV